MSQQTLANDVLDFELPNVGVGPDPLSLADVIDASDFAVLLFLRDHTRSRRNTTVFRPWIRAVT